MKIAMISAWHVHAPGYAKELMNMGETLYAVWDEIPERGQKWADELGAKFFDSYDELLADKEVEAVFICAPTNIHADLMIKAANAGKHIFTEKVMTLTNESAQAVKEAVLRNNVHFGISLPYMCKPKFLMVKRMIEEGKLGQITYGRVRNCHSGSIRDWLPPHFYNQEQCGGGAMIDLGAHPMYLLQWYLGKATKVSSSFVNATNRPVEDNAVSVIEFENGTIGVSETGFDSVCDPFTVEISGTKGYLHIGKTISYCIDGEGWVEVDESTIEDKQESPITYWLNSIKNDTPNELYNIDVAVELTRIMVAAYKASNQSIKAKY